MKTTKRNCVFVAALGALLCVTGCGTDANIASRNISIAAGNFEVDRRIVFYNGITGGYILTIEGRCQVEHAYKVAITCKTGEGIYKKHYLGLSDNVTYFSEQIEGVGVSVYRYRVVFKPESIVPDIDIRTSVTK